MAKLPVGKRPVIPADQTEEGEPQAAPEADADGVTWAMTDETILSHVRSERRNSIGFGEVDGGELVKRRTRALMYYKGDVTQDIEDVDKRSKAVSTDIAEAIDTSMPDLMEIFTAGDDTVTFEPNGLEDEQQARSETDFVNYVLFTLNDGFVNFQSAFKDALLLTTGLFHWWWEEESKDLPLAAQVPAELAAAVQQITAEVHGVELEQQPTPDDNFVTFQAKQIYGRVKYKAVPPDDFTVAQDTVTLKDTPYCCMRERARVQTLIERGLPKDKVEKLPEYAKPDEQTERARDEAGESDRGIQGSEGPLRVVELRTHYIRLDIDDDGKVEIVKVTTDFEEQVLIDKEVVDHIPFSALTPYMTPHRFYGESVADRLFEIMQIKTVLLRMALDSGYFALNQRFEISEEKASEFTLSDLLRNEPNMPVRSVTGDAVRPLTGGELGFDAFNALEYVSVMGEQRTGIMRNAQGLNPDTLHDTAHGAMALLSAAQKRLRFIARVFAETGVRDLARGIHQTLRINWRDGMMPLQKKIGSNWTSAKPSTWAERDTMKVDIGSGGKEQELATLTQQFDLVEKIVETQGGISGPLVTGDNIYHMLMAWSRAAGQKSPDRFWSDPSSPQMQQEMAAKAQQPSPEMQEAQGKLAIAQAESNAKIQQTQQQAQADLSLRQSQAQSDAQLARDQAASDAHLEASKAEADQRAAAVKAQSDHAQAMARIQAESALARERMHLEIQLQRERMTAELDIAREKAHNQPKPAGGD